MNKAIRLSIMFAMTFAIFILAGMIGIYVEQVQNNLIVSTSTFLGSFGILFHYVIQIYHNISRFFY